MNPNLPAAQQIPWYMQGVAPAPVQTMPVQGSPQMGMPRLPFMSFAQPQMPAQMGGGITSAPLPPPAPGGMFAPPPAAAAAQPRGGLFGAMRNFGDVIRENPMMISALGAGLMDKRQNNNVQFSDIVGNAMRGGAYDTAQKDRKEEGEEKKRTENATDKYLKKRFPDYSDDEILAIRSNPTLLSEVIKGGDATDDIDEYRFAQSQGYEGTFSDWLRDGRGGGVEYGLTPIYGEDQQGNAIVMLPGKDGSIKRVQTPDGVTISTGTEQIDLGTHFAIKDKRSGQIVGFLEKEVEAEAEAKSRGAATGEAQGKASASLPTIETNATFMTTSIDALLADPSLGSVTGPMQGGLPAMTGGQSRAQSRIDQVLGQAFLQAFETIKGAGAITEQEGAAATNAMTRLRTQRMGDADYRAAVEDLRAKIEDLVELARSRAGQAAPPAAAPAASGTTSTGTSWSVEGQ
jgi:hypothetical protein